MMREDQRQSRNTEESSNFESAIEACGFGMFNVCLLLACLPGLWSTVLELFTMSYVFPAAECDLDLSLMDKGALNAITFGGSIISAIPWGFMADTFSRKYILVFGLLADGLVTLLSVSSQTAEQLIAFKFFNGLILSGPVASFVSYISEFHGMKHRLYILMAYGFIACLPLLVLPVLSSLILPDQKIYIIGNWELLSWKFLIALTAIPSLLSGSLLLLFPESPRFLMAQGKNNQAMKVFQIIYAMNKLQPWHTYPITTLEDEAPEKALRRSIYSMRTTTNLSEKLQKLADLYTDGLEQFRILLTRSNITLTLMVCAMQFSLFLSVNTLGLWQPQTSAIIQEMKHKGLGRSDTCAVLKYSLNKTRLLSNMEVEGDQNCDVVINKSAYIDNEVIATAVAFNHIIAALLLRLTGNHILLRIYLVIASISQFLKYWSTSREISVFLAAVNTASGVVSATLLLNATVNLFPTVVRTMSVIFLVSCGRLGGVLGNLLFPLLMSLHCISVFVFYSVTYLCTLTLSFFLHNTTTEALK